MPTQCAHCPCASPTSPTRVAPKAGAIAAGAILCGMRGYKAISDWADALGQQARQRFGCRRENGRHLVPSEFVIRDCLVRIEVGALDAGARELESRLGDAGQRTGDGGQDDAVQPAHPPRC